jgi:hypothetical protein
MPFVRVLENKIDEMNVRVLEPCWKCHEISKPTPKFKLFAALHANSTINSNQSLNFTKHITKHPYLFNEKNGFKPKFL